MSEIRTLLLTDVVDSTQLAETLGDTGLAAVWDAHDHAARTLLPLHRGLEIDKTDGMLLMFDRVDDALAYARAYHDALAELPQPLRARAGVHVGAVLLRENAPAAVARGAKPLEVDGIAKPTVARLMSLAHGGQTLASREAVDALAALPARPGRDAGTAAGIDRDPADTAPPVHAHGHWQLKGITAPLEVLEVGPPPHRLPLDSSKCFRVARVGARWLPVREVPHNLPLTPNAFIGRDADLDALKAALQSSRLVTVVGMGGLGKTRLALQVAAELLAAFPDGVWLLDLVPLRDPDLVVDAAARVFGVRPTGDTAPLAALAAALRERETLLVLDNCEHLPEAAAALVHALLRAAPGLRVLATSRSALRAAGEQLFAVHPLPLPPPGADAATIAGAGAVQLFVERARAHRPDFVCDAASAPALAELVARLEGIPLALELAAARLRSLSVAEIDARLRDRYRLLTGGQRAVHQRQQTLRALVDWSYELLGEDERTLLRRLGVFVGGFDLAAAEAVAGVDPLDPLDLLDRLDVLVDQSIVTADTAATPTRYRMLETLREYACDKLDAGGELAETQRRHAAHFWTLARDGRNGLLGASQPQWSARLELELDNLRGAIAAAHAGVADPLIAAKATVALQQFWLMRGRLSEGRALVADALALPAVHGSPMARAHLHYVGAVLADAQGDATTAETAMHDCLALRRGLGDLPGVANALSSLTLVWLGGGRADEAHGAATEALALARQLSHRLGEAIAQLQLARVALHREQWPQADDHARAALAVGSDEQHHELAGECEWLLAQVALARGERAAAQTHLQAALGHGRRVGDRGGEAKALASLGFEALRAGELEAARAQLGDALRSFQGTGMQAEAAAALEAHAALAAEFGDEGVAASLLGAAQAVRCTLNRVAPPYLARPVAALASTLRDGLGEAAFDDAHTRGRGWSLADAAATALALAPQAV